MPVSVCKFESCSGHKKGVRFELLFLCPLGHLYPPVASQQPPLGLRFLSGGEDCLFDFEDGAFGAGVVFADTATVEHRGVVGVRPGKVYL